MARVSALPEWWFFYGVVVALLALVLCRSPGVLADDMSGHSTAGKTATASLRITLSIPSRARVRADAAGAETLCLMHIPARFLQVSWRSSGSARSTGTRKPLARLRGNPYVRDCIPLDTARVEKRDRGYLLITAE